MALHNVAHTEIPQFRVMFKLRYIRVMARSMEQLTLLQVQQEDPTLFPSRFVTNMWVQF